VNLAYLCAFIPSPVDDGDKVRAMWTLRSLAAHHRVYGFFLAPDGRTAVPSGIRALCRETVVVPLSRGSRAASALSAAASGRTVHAHAFWNSTAHARLADALSGWPAGAVHVHRIRMMPYAERLGLPYVLDCTDSIGAYYRHGAGLRGWRKAYAAFDRTRVAEAERRWGNGAEAVLAITEAERRKLVELGIRTPIFVSPNGLDLGHWRWSTPAVSSRELLFLGNLAYPPNEEGLSWFLSRVAPRLNVEATHARLNVVGGGASARLRSTAAAAAMPVRFSGFVPDVRAAYRRAAALICPLPTASGLQNKMVEAMACGVPVITTPNVAAAADARAGRDVLASSDPAVFAAMTARLLGSSALRRRLSRSARRLVETRFAGSVASRGIDAAVDRLDRAVRARD